ncbi:MAG: hypothetical protein VB050_02060 [Geobacteraceae bacterium]|nr:hypothetical protein [Geobacteraceae bacterium]
MISIRFVSSIIVFMALLHVTYGHARSPEDVMTEMDKAVDMTVSTYKVSGMTGLVEMTSDCYDKTASKEFICVYIDLASRYIDQRMSEAFNFPPTEFYQDEQFGARISGVFIQHDINMEKCNEYLRAATPAINKIVDHKLQ